MKVSSEFHRLNLVKSCRNSNSSFQLIIFKLLHSFWCLQTLELSSIWALLAAFEDPLPIPKIGGVGSFEGAFVKGVDSLSWMANNTSKLFPFENNIPQCWTFFSTAAYGKANKVPQVGEICYFASRIFWFILWNVAYYITDGNHYFFMFQPFFTQCSSYWCSRILKEICLYIQENIPSATAEKVKNDMHVGVESALGLSEGSLQKPFYSRAQLWYTFTFQAINIVIS